jgi:hypothetical protein
MQIKNFWKSVVKLMLLVFDSPAIMIALAIAWLIIKIQETANSKKVVSKNR